MSRPSARRAFRFLNVFVDVGGGDGARRAVTADVLKEQRSNVEASALLRPSVRVWVLREFRIAQEGELKKPGPSTPHLLRQT